MEVFYKNKELSCMPFNQICHLVTFVFFFSCIIFCESLSFWAAVTIAYPGWLKNNKFLTVLEAGKLKIKMLAALISVESQFPGPQASSSHGSRDERALYGLLYGYFLFMRPLPSRSIQFQKALLPNNHHTEGTQSITDLLRGYKHQNLSSLFKHVAEE